MIRGEVSKYSDPCNLEQTQNWGKKSNDIDEHPSWIYERTGYGAIIIMIETWTVLGYYRRKV